MPISPIGKASSRAASAGFTLVELLVVVTVVAILALGAGLTGGGVFAGASDTPRSLGAALQNSVQAARDEALLGRMPLGLHPRPDGWSIVRADGDGRWQPAGRPVRARGPDLRWLVDGARFTPALAPPGPADPPAVLFRPDGGGRAFAVTLVGAGQSASCRFDGWGAVTCD